MALSKASVMAGLAMSETQTALAHSLSYDLTINEGISHGEAVAIWLPMVSEMAFKSSGWLEAELAKEVGCEGSFTGFLRQWLENLAIQPRSISDLPNGVKTLNEALQSTRGQNQI
jgi:alcohol dehydrogenase class IV